MRCRGFDRLVLGEFRKFERSHHVDNFSGKEPIVERRHWLAKGEPCHQIVLLLCRHAAKGAVLRKSVGNRIV